MFSLPALGNRDHAMSSFRKRARGMKELRCETLMNKQKIHNQRRPKHNICGLDQMKCRAQTHAAYR